MTWVKVTDVFDQNPKVQRAGQAAAWLYVAGLCYCSRHLTDGNISEAALAGLGGYGRGQARRLAERLVGENLWERADGGYRVHDYLTYQPSKEAVEGRRQMRQRVGQAGGLASGSARSKR